MTQPANFLPSPGSGPRAHGAPLRLVEAPGFVPGFVPPPPPPATLTITPKGLLTPHQSLRAALGLRDGQPINLLPPVYGSPYWHLDLRESAPNRIKWYASSQPRVEGIKLPPGLLLAPLTLALLPGEPAYPHVYPLLPYANPA